MGVMTLQDFQNDLQAPGGTQRSNISPTLMTRWINQALKEFGYAFKFHEFEATKTWVTIANQISFGITTDVGVADLKYIEQMRKTAPNDRLGKLLPEVRDSYLLKLGDSTNTTTYGEPRYYHKWGNKLFLRPIQDARVVTIDLDYYKTIPNLVASTDVTPLHEDWDEAVCLGALYRGFRYFGEENRYINAKNDFLAYIRSRSTEYELEEFPEGGISVETGPTDANQVALNTPNRPWWEGDPRST